MSIPVKYHVSFPGSGWESFSQGFHVMTSFDLNYSFFSLHFASDVDLIVISSLGFSQLSIEYGSEEVSHEVKERLKKNPIVNHSVVNTDSTPQEIILQTPYSCRRANIHITSKLEEFPCIVNVKAFSSSYSSSISTPISKPFKTNSNVAIIDKGMHALKFSMNSAITDDS